MLRVLLLALCGLFASSNFVCADEAEDKAAAYVVAHGGYVQRDEKQPGKPVVKVDWSGHWEEFTRKDLQAMAPFKHLAELRLDRVYISNTDLKALAAFPNLTKLAFFSSGVTVEGLAALPSLRNLTTLDLTDSIVANNGLKKLAQLQNLISLFTDAVLLAIYTKNNVLTRKAT